MSDTVKLIIEIDERLYERIKYYEPNGNTMAATALHSIANGTPLNDVKVEIEKNAYPIVHGVNNHEKGMTLCGILQVLNNIGKTESGVKNNEET